MADVANVRAARQMLERQILTLCVDFEELYGVTIRRVEFAQPIRSWYYGEKDETPPRVTVTVEV